MKKSLAIDREGVVALRICARCGELAANASCESCRRIARKATQLAAWAFEKDDVVGIQVEPCVTKADRLLARMAEAEFHRLRAARLFSEQPSIEGLQPGVFPPGKAARGLWTWMIAMALFWLLFLPLLRGCAG